jgi:hypothetical protein
MERTHHWWRNARHGHLRAGFRQIVDPRFEERVIGQDQIGENTGFIEEASKAHDIRNPAKRFFGSPRRGSAENRVRVVEKKHLNRG